MSKNCIAIKACLLLALLSAAAAVAAGPPVGAITELDGRLLVKNASGAIKVLGLASQVQAGDLLATKKNTYARVSLAGGNSVTLQPDTLLRVEQYSFDATKPLDGVAVLRLESGGVRIAAGQPGKDGNGTFTLITPAGTIDIAGATFIVQYVAPVPTAVAARGTLRPTAYAPVLLAFNDATVRSDAVYDVSAYASVPLQIAQNTAPPGSAAPNPGLYVQVLDGTIHVTNQGGTQNFTAGQFGFTPGFQQPPVILPSNPGMQFTPPPSFTSTTGAQGGTGGKPGAVDCVVR